ncbi:uncharacterized protein LOC125647222 [Ostrea edulis]|uniref:uncharacterized protein LOC125647222 n=1 Tax=Ostrea edulis TaxID=37623 RepID=UPI0024AF0650|nr:uncharacterized protein LOC125647222 [Ostrea edulis]
MDAIVCIQLIFHQRSAGGMYNPHTSRGKVVVYDMEGKPTQGVEHSSRESTQGVEHNSREITLYSYPCYITDNRNGDIIVSDYPGAVVVTERGGRHRFSYTGPPSGSGLTPRGICTDALSHILVCDENTHTVQMIDKDGHFLFLLLTRQHGINGPYSLHYDDKTHLLWVGSEKTNTLSLDRYIQRRDPLTGK